MSKIVSISGMAELQEYLQMLDRLLNENVTPVKVHGAMRAILFKENGEIFVHAKDNMIVAGGFDFICDALCLSASRPAVLSYIGVGTNTAAPAIGNTALGTELNRQAATYAHTAGTQNFTLTANFAAGVATGAITEAAVFNASAAGTMIDRVTFGVINKGAADTLQQQFVFSLT